MKVNNRKDRDSEELKEESYELTIIGNHPEMAQEEQDQERETMDEYISCSAILFC